MQPMAYGAFHTPFLCVDSIIQRGIIEVNRHSAGEFPPKCRNEVFRLKRWIFLLCCALLMLSVAGCTGREPVQESGPEPSSAQAQLQEDPKTAAALELVKESPCDAPDFLTEEQQTLYRKARTAYAEFTLVSTGFGTNEWTPVTVEGEEEESFFVGDGSITTWDDFETAMLGLFTPEYLEELNINITVLEDGTTHRYVHFVDYQGQLAFTVGARGSNPAYLGPDTFELISRTEDEIRFYLIGTYHAEEENEEGELVWTEETTQEKYEIVLTRTENGWRFSKFALPA